MSERVEKALEELEKLKSPEEALAVIEATEEKRKKLSFVKYWEATTQEAEALAGFTPDKKIFGVLGGNRSGKTELGAFVSVAWALGKDYFKGEPAWSYVKGLPIPNPPNNIWVVGLDFPTLRDVIWREKLETGKEHPPMLPKDPGVVLKNNSADFQIFFKNGSIMTGKSAESGREKFQAASVDLVWIDEEPEAEIFDECYQRTIDCGGKILLTLTPLTDIASGVRTPWVFDLYEKVKAGKKDAAFVQLSVLKNPYVPEEEKLKLREKWEGHFEERARLFGEFVQRSGLVYNMWKPEKHMVKPFVVPGHWTKIVSIDPAATGVTAALWAAVDGGGNITLYREYYELDRVISEHAKSIRIKNTGDPIDVWLIDPKYGQQRNAETHKSNAQLYKDAGIPVRLAEVGPDFGLNSSLEYMNAALVEGSRHPRIQVFDDLHHFRWEIEHYSWAFFTKGEQRGLTKEKPIKRNDHLMNCWQYLAAMRPRYRQRQEMTDSEKRKYAEVNSYT